MSRDVEMRDAQEEIPAGNNPPVNPSPEVLAQMMQGMIQLQQQQVQQNQQARDQAQGQVTQIKEGFQLLANSFQGQAGVQQRVGGIKDFRSLHPKEFNGSESPIDAEEWLKGMLMLLIAAAVPEEERVNVVQVQFTGIARAWFDVLYDSVEEDLTWETFSSQFYEQFFPEDARFEIEERFMKLEQGDRSVD